MRIGIGIGVNRQSSNGGAAWTPASIPNGAMWLRADTVTEDTGGVDLATDKFGLGNDASQSASANRPDLIASDSNLNSQPSMTFDASQALDCALNEASSDWTIFAAVQNDVAAGIRAILDSPSIRFRGYGTNLRCDNGATNLTVSMGAGAHVVCARLGSSGLVRVDASEATGTLAAAAYSIPHLGSRYTNYTTDNWQGEIAEVIVYQRALTDDEIDTVMEYLGARYGVSV